MSELRILHLASDEKFIDQAIKAFEREAPGCNLLLVYGKRPFKHVKSEAAVFSKSKAICSTARDLPKHDLVVIHSLDPVWFLLIKSLPPSSVLIWIGWGYDYYDIINKNKSETLLPITYKKWQAQNEKSKTLKKLIFFKKFIFSRAKRNIIKKIDIFCPVLPSEYENTKISFKSENFPKKGSWNYGNLEEDLINGFEEQSSTGNNLLVGNNSSAENNHLDTFALLAGIGIENRKIISPLSYGNFLYRDLVIMEGKRLFLNNFHPITEFLPIQEYIRTLQSCGFVIMDHLRQQAVGNIIIMMHLGAKIFLNEKCPTLAFLKDQGAEIFSTAQLKAYPSMLNEGLDPKAISTNRRVVSETWSKRVSQQRTRDLLSFALSIKK